MITHAGDTVHIVLTDHDYLSFLRHMATAMAAYKTAGDERAANRLLAFLNEMHAGDPLWKPYELFDVPAKKEVRKRKK